MSRSTRADIDLQALRSNYARLRALAPRSRVMAVIKADAYGHGALAVAQALAGADLMGVAYIDEALPLRAAGVQEPLVLLEGVMNAEEYTEAARHGLQVVIHRSGQIDWLERCTLSSPLVVWLKVDTGMHRLGLAPDEVASALHRLQRLSCVSEIVMMSHLACADEPGHPLTALQQARFEAVSSGRGLRRSLANSAGILLGDAFHHDIVRPGIMLYGAAASAGQDLQTSGFRPVMRLLSSVLSVRTIASGESVGYGATWVASRETRVAIVAIGYGDGYPRHVTSGACVQVSGRRCPVIGRVSMDMLAIDVTDVAVEPGAVVELWGPSLPVEEVAGWAGTLNYELLCQVTDRVRRHYAGEAA